MTKSIIKLDNKNERFTVFPIVHNNLWDFYKKHLSTFWTVEEINISDDLNDWNNKLNDNERFFIKNVLAFFAASDGIVNENLVLNFYQEIELPEARQFYSVQMMIEAIHSEMYSLLIDTYIQNSDEKSKLFNAIDTIPAIKRKAEWAIKWVEDVNLSSSIQNLLKKLELELELKETKSDNLDELKYFIKERPSFAQRILAFVCVEGIFFSGSFCAIYWLKNKGLMPSLATANEFISRDENLHAEFAIELYNMLTHERLDETVVHSIFKEAVDIEKEFIIESLPVSLLGMNSNLMSEYIEFVANRWIVMLGYNKLYPASQNPFGFMELISVNTKENFFESRVSQYTKANVGQSVEDRTITFDDEDF